MARKFLYLIAFLILLVVAVLSALAIWGTQLTQMALTPTIAFEPKPPVAANAYQAPELWHARPGVGASDPTRWMPGEWAEDADASTAGVFFIHPTSYLNRQHWNAPLDDAESQNRARLFLQGMASPFNKSLNIWAPRYRQAAIGAFLTDKPEARQALDLAYGDVLAAFDVFIAAQGKDTPIILAGHSQGSLHLTRLLKERVAGTPLARRVIAAYVIGWPVSIAHDLPSLGLPACATADQPGCVISYSSFAEPADPSAILDAYGSSPGLDGTLRKGSAILCTNPLTGTIGGEAAVAAANPGTLVPSKDLREGTIRKGMIPAQCDPATGMLLIGAPPEMGPYVLPGNNYHVYDYPLFWAAIRGDVARRQAAWHAGSRASSQRSSGR